MKKSVPEKDSLPKERIHFCTECGAQLDDFALSASATDLEAIKRLHEQCKQTGKFKGEFCSKLFIAEPIDPEQYENPDDIPPST